MDSGSPGLSTTRAAQMQPSPVVRRTTRALSKLLKQSGSIVRLALLTGLTTTNLLRWDHRHQLLLKRSYPQKQEQNWVKPRDFSFMHDLDGAEEKLEIILYNHICTIPKTYSVIYIVIHELSYHVNVNPLHLCTTITPTEKNGKQQPTRKYVF